MNEQELQQAFIQFLAQKTGAKTQQELESAIQQMGEEGLKQAYAEFMQIVQQQQVQAAKFGAKLDYIKKLRGQCPEGYEIQYYKVGGQICKECKKKEVELAETQKNPIDAFKCGRKMRKKKCENGDVIEKDKCGSKVRKKKCEEGGFIPFNKKGDKIKKKGYPLIENGKTNYYSDRATRDSIAVNKYGAEDIESTMPSVKGKKNWTPDRSKAPYNKVKKGQQGLAFYRQESKFPKGHAVISESILTPIGKNHNGTWHYPDFQKNPGRNIYVSPHGNDTVYYNYPDNYSPYTEGYMPIGDTKNQVQAKSRFMQLVKKSQPYNQESRTAWRRARTEK